MNQEEVEEFEEIKMIKAEIWICPKCDDFRMHWYWTCECLW